MADPTGITATHLCSAKGSLAGQVQWWLFNFDLAAAATSINVTKLVEAGPGTGTMVAVVDGGAADSAKGKLILNTGTTGLLFQSDSTTEIKFLNVVNGSTTGAPVKEIDAVDVIVTIAV